MSGKNRNRADILDGITFDPYPNLPPLGEGVLHGPPREDHIVVVLGVGPGLGLAIAQTFARKGYTTAIASRTKSRLDSWAVELDQTIKKVRGSNSSSEAPQSAAFSCDVLSVEAIHALFANVQKTWPNKKIGTAIFNASIRRRGPFLEQSHELLDQSVQASIFGGFTFIQDAVAAMDKHKAGGNVLVTGATSSIRGREGFAAFAASKGGLRAICQSVAREFGPRNIHVAHIIVDGLIDSQQARDFIGLEKGQRFSDSAVLRPEAIAQNFLFLAQQSVSAWTFELDVRPAKEHF